MVQGLGVSINEGFGVRIWDLHAHAGKMRQSRQRQDRDTKAKTKTKTMTKIKHKARQGKEIQGFMLG